MIIMMLSITAKNYEGIHSMSLQRQRHTQIPPHITSTSFHKVTVLLLAQQCRQRAGLNGCSPLCLSALATHTWSICNNESMIAMTTSSDKNISNYKTTQSKLRKKKTRTASQTLAHSIDDWAGLGSCTLGVMVDECEREGICVALQR